MKKVFFIFALLSLPAMATDIPYTNDSYTSSTCDSGVLQHDSGTVRLRARYEPNTINIRWYNNNTELNPTNTAANTCDYDDDLTLPNTQPTRTGYTFAGWRVRPQMDFGTIPTDVDGRYRYNKGTSLNLENLICYYQGKRADCNNSGFADLQPYEWKTGFNHGVVYGMAKCSAISGPYQSASTLTDADLDSGNGDKQYCWCRVTGYKPSNSNIIYAPTSVLPWVYGEKRTVESCIGSCGNICAVKLWEQSRVRSVSFNPAN